MEMIESVEVEIRVRNLDEKMLDIIHRSTNLENAFAPETLNLEAKKVKNEIVFKCKMDFKENPNAKFSTLRRTVDDYIWSAGIAYSTIESLKRDKN